ncbi:MAG: hypothetical protein WBC44_12070 [Planctomycetaceae bacterium]
MTVITIDRSTGDKLLGLHGPVQLRDERGFVLGKFRPADDADRVTSAAGRDETESQAALRRMVERMRRASVSAEAFPITREALHERR